jgi:hypothetical protein
MISPEAGQMWFRIAFIIVALSVILLLTLTPGSEAYVVSVMSLVVGLVFMLVLIILIRRSQR